MPMETRFWSGWRSHPRWFALWAAFLGYLLDAMDVLLYVFALPLIRDELGLTNQAMGVIAAVTLVTSAAGGIAAGALADRFGRRRVLAATILVYSLASAGAATSQTLLQLCLWRALIGAGLGGEWAAGAALVAESWPANLRGRAIGFMQSGWALGYMAAALVSGIVLPRFGWRTLFLVGVAPALLAAFVRRHVREPEAWRPENRAPWLSLFRPPLAGITLRATAVATSVLFGYWGLFTWLPAFLASPRTSGGAGLGIAGSARWTLIVQAGALAGYLTFGILSDRLGRRPAFLIYVLAAAALVPIYGLAPQWAGENAAWALLALGAPLGFFGSGYFSLFGALLSELFPDGIRGSGVGLTYNFGRALSAFAPVAIGALADGFGFGTALLLNSAFFLAAAGLIFLLPETRIVR